MSNRLFSKNPIPLSPYMKTCYRPFRRYSKKLVPKKVTFDQFWAAIQRIQTKQTLNKLLTSDVSFLKQLYSLPSTIIDYLIKSCATKFLFDLSKTCKELTCFTRKLRGRSVGYLILRDENCKRNIDLGITTCVNKNELKKDLMLICNFKNVKYLKNITCEDVLEIHCSKHGILEEEKLSLFFRIRKKLQHKILIVLTDSGQLTVTFNDFQYSILFHENLTEIDTIANIIPLKYLPQLKNCRSIRFAADFKDSVEEVDQIFSLWEPLQKFKKFVIQVKTDFIPEIFITFITKFMAENSIFAFNIPINMENNLENLEDDEILHSMFCHHFENVPRSCYTTIIEFFNQQETVDHFGYHITFGNAQFCNDIFEPKNCLAFTSNTWKNICSTSIML